MKAQYQVTARLIRTRGEELGVAGLANVLAFMVGYRAWLLTGKAGEALKFVMDYMPLPNMQAHCLAYLGRDKEVAGILEQLVLPTLYLIVPLPSLRQI